VKVWREQDVRTAALTNRRIAVLGFGSQGRAQALNLRDSGCDVIVGLRPGSPSRTTAEQAGLTVCAVADAIRRADVVLMLIPDERQPDVYAQDIAPLGRRGLYLGFAHGFAIHFRKLVPTPDTNVFLVAPKGIGPMVRQRFEQGGGVPALTAVHQDPPATRATWPSTCACGLGCGRAGIMRRRFVTKPRPTSSASRLCSVAADGADPRRLRDARRSGLRTGARVLRVSARGQADRRPDPRARHRRHARRHQPHRGLRRRVARPARDWPADARGDA
jgi:hypothetical protein